MGGSPGMAALRWSPRLTGRGIQTASGVLFSFPDSRPTLGVSWRALAIESVIARLRATGTALITLTYDPAAGTLHARAGDAATTITLKAS